MMITMAYPNRLKDGIKLVVKYWKDWCGGGKRKLGCFLEKSGAMMRDRKYIL